MKHSHALNTILFAIFLLVGFLDYREFLQVNILAYFDQQNIWGSRHSIAFLVFRVLSLVVLALAMRGAWMGVPFLPGMEKARRLLEGFKLLTGIFPVYKD